MNIWHINNFSVAPITDPPEVKKPDCSKPMKISMNPDENVYVPWVPYIQHINF